MMHAFWQKVIDRILEPYASWETFRATATGIVTLVTDVRSKFGWPWLLWDLVLVYVIYRVAKRRGRVGGSTSLREFVFPKAVFLHPSAIVDYKFVLTDQLVRGLLYAPLVTGISYFLYVVLSGWLGQSSLQVPPNVALWIVPIYAFLVVDFGYYFGHVLQHKLPFLWPFHEIHHSAEVLSLVTVYRIHPVEEMVNGVVHAVLFAISAACLTSVTDIRVDPYELFGLNALTFLYFALGSLFRHSHIRLSYGPVLERIFSSPAQHHVHHSVAAHHWNKNFGLTLSVWDVCFGTLYLPAEEEEIRFGSGDPADFSTVAKLYFLPFVKSYRVLTRRFRPHVLSAPSESPLPAATRAKAP
jgi:sterol desaturase/sphingolipid hydroxylase (fatty acid hydroxylase superfamily)